MWCIYLNHKHLISSYYYIYGILLYQILWNNRLHYKRIFLPSSLQSPLNLIAPEAVDEGVQHGDHHHVEHRHHLVLVSWVAGLGHHVNERDGPIEHSDCCEVGRAGGEGLVAPLGGVHLQDGDEDVDVGYSYNNCCDHNDGASCKWRDNGRDTDVRTGEFNQRSKIAEKMIDFIWSTEL